MKPFLGLFAGISSIALFIAALLKGFDLRNIVDVILLIPIVVTIDSIAWFIFTTLLWRWNFLHSWLIPFPDLNGTWKGNIQKDRKDAEGQTPDHIPTILTIKQSFGRISCVMRTEEMESRSYVEGFRIDKNVQVRQLCYLYTSKPKTSLRIRSTPHDGSILFNIIGTPAKKLNGEYWTQRKTTGTVELTFLTKKRLDEMPTDSPADQVKAVEDHVEQGD